MAENIADAVQCNSLMSCECCPIPERRKEEEIGGGIRGNRNPNINNRDHLVG